MRIRDPESASASIRNHMRIQRNYINILDFLFVLNDVSINLKKSLNNFYRVFISFQQIYFVDFWIRILHEVHTDPISRIRADVKYKWGEEEGERVEKLKIISTVTDINMFRREKKRKIYF